MRYSPTNKKGEYTMTGIFLEAKTKMEADRKRYGYKFPPITVAQFTRVMNLYIQMMFHKIIVDGVSFPFRNKFGHIMVVQSLCIRYNPTKTFFTTVNGNVQRHTQKIKLVNGRWAYMFWDAPKIWRMFKFVPAPNFKRQISELFFAGKQYSEMDLTKYGRMASPTYIQFRK